MIEPAIVSLLSASTALTTLVADRIYDVVVREETDYPCLSYQVVSGSADYTLDSTAIETKRFQFDGWAFTYQQVKQIEAALHSVLDGLSGDLSDGSTVISADRLNVIDNWEATSRVYRVTVEYEIRFSS